MTPDRIIECRQTLFWSRPILGDILGLDEKQIRRCEAGESSLSEAAAEWLEQLASFVKANPPPMVNPGRAREAQKRRLCKQRRGDAPALVA